jgi:hypothetical protein
MAKNQILNRAHQKAWYYRIRNDPARWRDYLEKKRVYKCAKRAALSSPKPMRERHPALLDVTKPDARAIGVASNKAESLTLDWLLNAFVGAAKPLGHENPAQAQDESQLPSQR